MDFTSFDRNFDKLRLALSSMADAQKTHYRITVYGDYFDYNGQIKSIVGRIEDESQKFVSFSKQVFTEMGKEKPNNELLLQLGDNLVLLRLDIESFYIFTRMFLDTLARVVRLLYGKNGEQLPTSMTDLLKSKKFEGLDNNFSSGLREKMSWYDDFTLTRDNIVHFLGSMVSTPTRDGSLGFGILGVKDEPSWGTDTMKPIIRYVEDILNRLSEVILCISNMTPQLGEVAKGEN